MGYVHAAGDQAAELHQLLRRGGVISEMHNAGCRGHTGCSCLIVAVDRDGVRHTFRAPLADLLEPDIRCVCSEYR
jgi:hypothetical protein